jgi:ElaB/YqjD/DUF883 family membrane-anchored ribosome-binding protein
MTEHTREVHQYLVSIPIDQNWPTQTVTVDLRSYDRDELFALRRRLVGLDTSPVSWQQEIAAIDYLTDGHYTRDQEADAEKLGVAQLSPEAAAVRPNPPTHDELIERVNKLTADLATAHAGFNQMNRERVEAQETVAALRNTVEFKDRELARFKEEVVEVATRYAEEHNWCAVIDQALEDLGLERAPKSYTAVLEIEVTFTAELRHRQEDPSEDWVRDSISTRAIENAIEEAFALDSDHKDHNITDTTFRVTSVEMDD